MYLVYWKFDDWPMWKDEVRNKWVICVYNFVPYEMKCNECVMMIPGTVEE